MKLVDEESISYGLANDENEFLTQYLPSQMSEKEIREAVQVRLATLEELNMRLMGQTMQWLKDNHGGKYDGKLASKVVKGLLNG
jgi:uncharacterized protein YqeY